MRAFRFAAALGFLCLIAVPAEASDDLAATLDGATIFRVFLKDGSSLVSYGELARVDNRVVFSMPTSASVATRRRVFRFATVRRSPTTRSIRTSSTTVASSSLTA